MVFSRRATSHFNQGFSGPVASSGLPLVSIPKIVPSHGWEPGYKPRDPTYGQGRRVFELYGDTVSTRGCTVRALLVDHGRLSPLIAGCVCSCSSVPGRLKNRPRHRNLENMMSWTCSRRGITGRGTLRSLGLWWPGACRATWHHFRTVGVYSLSAPAAFHDLGIGALPYGPSP